MRSRSPSRSITRNRLLVALTFALATALLASAPTTAAQSAAAGPAAQEVTDERLIARAWPSLVIAYRQQLEDAGIVGSSLLLMHQGQVAGSAYEGFEDVETRKPIDENTIYHWASVTKTFTGIAIMQLRDRGLLDLDDPVIRYVPELGEVHNPFGPMEDITIRHVMSHSAGFRASTWPWGGGEPWHPFEPTRWAQLAAMMPYTEVQFAPGTEYSYSNPAVIFLGRIIEQLSGDDYEMYVTKNILMPLGMHRTFFDRAPPHLLHHRSHSYFLSDAGLEEAAFDFDTGITVSNGGLNSPFTDMTLYLDFLLGNPERQVEYDRILARSSLEEMFAPVIRAEDGEGGSGPDVRAALSFFVERHQGLQLVGHSGNQNGFILHLYLYPPTRSGYLVAFNTYVTSEARGSDRITQDVDDAIRDLLIERILSAL